jgi:dTDP-4-dehydrorhamnose 3,5-epimerase
MKIIEKLFKGVFEIQLEPHEDHRGFFMRTYDNETFKKFGIHYEWVQENQSRSFREGILRGLHFQFPPHCETKLVRCVRGSVFDVYVDLRKDSPTFGKWESVELSESNKNLILIPRGFAHGFCTITEECEVLYKVDNVYQRPSESGIIWNDPDLKIDWPVKEPILSPKDERNITLAQFIEKHQALEI